MNPLPKRYGKKLPLIIDNGERVCFSVTIPDQLEYRAALMGQLNDMGFWFSWDHTQADMHEPHERQSEAAQLWLNTIADASFEVCMSFCEQLIACLTEDGDTQDALAELIRTNPAISEALSQWTKEHPTGTVYPKKQPLPPSVTEGNILPPNPECDPDILYGQCVGICQTANRMVQDFLETWETYNNSGEVLSDVVQAVPFVGEIADIIGISGILEYANDLIDAIAENYASDYDLEYEQALSCEIFCAAKGDCAVSLDMLANIMNARIGSALNLDNGTELLISLIDMDVSGFNVADLYLAAFFNMLKVANLILPITWGIEGYLRTIATFNTPDDDWKILCVDCPEIPNINLVATGIFDIYGTTTFLGFDEDGNDIWECGLVNNPLTTYAVCSVKDNTDRCLRIESFSGPIVEASWKDCDGINSGTEPTLDVSVEYLIINAQCVDVTSVVTLHLRLA